MEIISNTRQDVIGLNVDGKKYLLADLFIFLGTDKAYSSMVGSHGVTHRSYVYDPAHSFNTECVICPVERKENEFLSQAVAVCTLGDRLMRYMRSAAKSTLSGRDGQDGLNELKAYKEQLVDPTPLPEARAEERLNKCRTSLILTLDLVTELVEKKITSPKQWRERALEKMHEIATVNSYTKTDKFFISLLEKHKETYLRKGMGATIHENLEEFLTESVLNKACWAQGVATKKVVSKQSRSSELSVV